MEEDTALPEGLKDWNKSGDEKVKGDSEPEDSSSDSKEKRAEENKWKGGQMYELDGGDITLIPLDQK